MTIRAKQMTICCGLLPIWLDKIAQKSGRWLNLMPDTGSKRAPLTHRKCSWRLSLRKRWSKPLNATLTQVRFRLFYSSDISMLKIALQLPALFLSLALCWFQGLANADEITFGDKERIVLLGDGLIEQEQYHGWIELAITTAFPDKDLTFRNLGWNGDTPRGESRYGLSLVQAGHANKDECWKQLLKQIKMAQPTIAILGYGMASSLDFDSPDNDRGKDKFLTEYRNLITAIQKINPDIQIVLLSTAPTRSGFAWKSDLQTSSIKSIAQGDGLAFVDLSVISGEGQFHQDPIHLNSNGYREAAKLICQTLKVPESDWETNPHAEPLRQEILQKNVWWFHRSRPANMAYVFGFRKREQGQNAVEIPQYDSLITDAESRIAKLRDLKTTAQPPAPKTESKFAKFEAQPTPEFTVAEGFSVSLFAENPMLNKPIQMNFDPQGRLWVASSEAYPMIEVGQTNPDKIIVLEDTTGNGKADKSTVFADGLLIPTGVLPGDGGVYVAQSTDLLFLKDNDSDLKADEKIRLLSGFGTEDTHHNLHTLLWGPDGRLHMNQAVYTRTDTETPFGVVRLKGGGGFRLDPRNLRLEVTFRGLWNSWGHQFDEFGNSFLTDGAGFNGIAYSFPGATFLGTPKARKQLDLISPGRWPKFCSEEIIYGDTFPPQWQGSLITCDFRANRVTRFDIVEQGAGFATEQRDDLLRTSSASFRPIDVKQGPDGALYIADWSNPIINHGEVDFRDPRRDRWHGRIWRLTWDGAKPKKKVDLTKQTIDQLLENLLSDDRYTRDKSRRVLIDRSKETLKQLPSWIAAQSDETALLQGLWLSQSLNQPNQELLERVLSAKNPSVRSAAVRVLNDWSAVRKGSTSPIAEADALKVFKRLAQDESPRVRLEAVRGLGRLNSFEATTEALQVLNLQMDRFIDHALWLTVDQSSELILKEFSNTDSISTLAPKHVEYVLTALRPTDSASMLGRYLDSNEIPADGSGPGIELIGKAGSRSQLTKIFESAVSGHFTNEASTKVLSALAQAHQTRKTKPTAPERIQKLIKSPDSKLQSAAIALAGQWNLASQVGALKELALAPETSAELRSVLIASLRQMKQPSAIEVLVEMTEAISADPLSSQGAELVAALASSDFERALPFIKKSLSTVEDDQVAQQLWNSLLSNQGAAELLGAQIDGSDPSSMKESVARIGLRIASEEWRKEQATLIAALTPLSGESVATLEMTPERIKEMAAQAVKTGNPRRGELIYRRQALACTSCHAIGGVGGKVGPDMTSLGASAPLDYIVESLFDPNAKIKEGYHSVIIATDEGKLVTGIEVQSDDTETIIRTADNKVIRIPDEQIDGKKNGKSIMPSGVIDGLKKQEQLDLISFLGNLGKPGAFDASLSGVARRFEAFSGNHRVEQLGVSDVIDGSRVEGWKTLDAMVNGDLTRDSLRTVAVKSVFTSLVNLYVRVPLNVSTERTATIEISGPTKIAAWIDGKPVEVKPNSTTEASGKSNDLKTHRVNHVLQPGAHMLLIRFDANAIPEAVRVESKDVSFVADSELDPTK